MKRIAFAVLMTSLHALVLSACSSNEQPDGNAATVATNHSQQSAKPVSSSTKAMALTKADAAIDISFEYQDKPQPGAPLPIKLKLVGLQDLTGVSLQLSATELTISEGAQLKLPAMAVGAVQEQMVTVAAARPGIYVVDVLLQGKLADHERSWSYAIPVAVADPASASAAASSAVAP